MRIVVFILLAFGFSWGLWYGVSPLVDRSMWIPIIVVYMFGPLAAGLITASIFDRGAVGAALATRFRFNLWWLVAWLAAPVLIFTAVLIAQHMPGAGAQSLTVGAENAFRAAGREMPADMVARLPSLPVLVLIGMVAGILPNSIAAFGEEAGWRGYLWTQVRGWGFWRASLFVGFVWGIWHAPIIMIGHNYGVDYDGYPWAGVIVMTAFTMGLSPLMGLLRDRTGSVFPAAIFHGTLNAVVTIGVLLVAGGASPLMSVGGGAGIAAGAGAALIVAFLRPNRTPLG